MISQLDSDEDVVLYEQEGKYLYFTAPWCQPCKRFGPQIERVADELDINVGKVNADFAPGTLRKYQVRAVPTIVKLDNQGNMIEYHTGVQNDDFLKEFFS